MDELGVLFEETKGSRMVAKTPRERQANTACLLWVLQEDDTTKKAVLEIASLRVLVLIAMGWADEIGDDTPYIGITDMAIDVLCDRVGPERARQLCGVE